ncbi:unnamed protein product [Ixodes hexagonus]
MPQCCAVGCTMQAGTNKLSKVKLFRFPRNEERRQAWAVAVKRAGFVPNNDTRICSKHFTTGAPSDDPNHPDWVPRIFAHRASSSRRSQPALRRYHRASLRVQPEAADAPDVSMDGDADSTSRLEPGTPVEQEEITGVSCVTDLSSADIDTLLEENRQLKMENQALKDAAKTAYGPIDLKNDAEVEFFTGLPSSGMFWALLYYILALYTPKFSAKIPHWRQLLMVLMKLRLGLLNKDLSSRFGISPGTVSKIFHAWINILSVELSPCILWPEANTVRRRLPKLCKVPMLRNLRCIIDCSEIFIERPCTFKARTQTFSPYKHHNTVKFLIAICPSGGICFISKCWGGKVSDLELTRHCGFLDFIQSEDLIMADRVFPIEELLAIRGASLIVPAYTRGKTQLTRREVEVSRRISSVRIQVERTIGQLKKFHLLQRIIPVSLLKKKGDRGMTIDKIIIACAALVNMRSSIFGKAADAGS